MSKSNPNQSDAPQTRGDLNQILADHLREQQRLGLRYIERSLFDELVEATGKDAVNTASASQDSRAVTQDSRAVTQDSRAVTQDSRAVTQDSRAGEDTAGAAPWMVRESPTVEKPSDKRESLDEIRKALGDCTRCPLHQTRTNIVFGTGDANARLMIIGEAPGEREDQLAEPFVGTAGQLLTKMIEAMGLQRDDVYIANVLKCRPPDNRDPAGTEVAHCSPFLERQIHSVKPEVIISLGRHATNWILGETVPLGRTRGTWRSFGTFPVMPTWHPAYLLRNPAAKKDAWADLQLVMKKLGLS